MQDTYSPNHDKDLIIALTEDYLNVYRIIPDEDLVDVVKLNGFITEGIGSNWSRLCYSKLLQNYTNSRVNPSDREFFLKECGTEHIREALKDGKMFQGHYTVLEDGAIHYYAYKYVKVSGDNESLRVVAAFSNVDSIVSADKKKMAVLEDMRNIIAASEMGTWHIIIMNDGSAPRMSVDKKMGELLGLDGKAGLSEEEIYTSWYSRIDRDAVETVKKSVNTMLSGQKDENTYKWWHPVLGARYVRCGGTATAIPGGHMLSGYHYDVTEQTLREIERQKKLEDSIAANKAKTMFLLNMSHEIRTPLNALFGFSQLLGLPDGSWTESEKATYSAYIFNSYNVMDMLIGDIIDIADSEHGNYRIEITDVNVNEVCRNALMSVDYRKPEAVNTYFTSELADDLVIRSDGRRIQQVLINYLSNACKHTKQGEIHLHCSTSETPGSITFSVADTGTGIPAEKADIIFNRFTKLNDSVQGSGLGLNICQLVASKLGGKVYLDKSYTGGARFVFELQENGLE